jgi:hypothetical protein
MSKFDQLAGRWQDSDVTKQSADLILKVVHTAGELYAAAAASLRHSPTSEIEADLAEQEKLFDRFQKNARARLLDELAALAGEAHTAGLVLVNLVIELEQVVDFTNNLATVAQAHQGPLQVGSFEPRLNRLKLAIGKRFGQVIESLRDKSDSIAAQVVREPNPIPERCYEIIGDLLAGRERLLPSGEAVTLAFYVRFLERIAAHLFSMLAIIDQPVQETKSN